MQRKSMDASLSHSVLLVQTGRTLTEKKQELLEELYELLEENKHVVEELEHTYAATCVLLNRLRQPYP